MAENMVEELLPNGNKIEYRVIDGTCYAIGTVLADGTRDTGTTSPEVAGVLERCRREGNRIRLWYGDTTTGVSWYDEWDVMGRVARSCGTISIPILIANRRSYGGGAILTRCIVRIDDIATHRTLYVHPHFNATASIANEEGKYCVYSVDGTALATFPSENRAQRYVDFMVGKSYRRH